MIAKATSLLQKETMLAPKVKTISHFNSHGLMKPMCLGVITSSNCTDSKPSMGKKGVNIRVCIKVTLMAPIVTNYKP